MRREECCRYFGRTLRISIFILNATGWIVGMLCLLGSTVIGFYSQTIRIRWHFDFYDFTLTTPCTIMFYYGIALWIASTSGCFAGSGGRWWSTGLYCLFLILLMLFDYYKGIRVFFKTRSLIDFLGVMEDSMEKYEDMNATFGIISHPVFEYWDHIQQQSHCCGMFGWRDWKTTPVGKKNNIPDSCCNEKYRTESCGKALNNHPDDSDHQTPDMVHRRGCLQVYPRRFIWAFYEASILGLVLAIILLLCFICSLILFFIVVTCLYRPGHPIVKTGHRKRSRRRSSAIGRGPSETPEFLPISTEPPPGNEIPQFRSSLKEPPPSPPRVETDSPNSDNEQERSPKMSEIDRRRLSFDPPSDLDPENRKSSFQSNRRPRKIFPEENLEDI